ncbi:MAG TPA: hypothetical protein DD435_12895 [Cyanobacteria bacterium UBA8530]|nr:hypothetical protein [Cyanobacteria bacterium UBA8530]
MVYNVAMPDYVLYAVLAAALFAGLSIAQKLTVRYSIPEQAVLLCTLFFIQAAFAPIIWFFHPIQNPAHVWPFLLGQALINIAANVLYYYSLYRVDISVLGSLWPLKNIFNVFWGFLLFGEVFSMTSYGWIFLCIAGAVLVAFNEDLRLKAFLQPAILLLVLTFFLFSASDVLITLCLKSLDPWNQRAWSMLLCGSFPLLVAPFLRGARISKRQFGSVFAINLFLMLGTVAITQAFMTPGAFTVASVLAMLDAPFLFAGLALLAFWKKGILESHPKAVYGVRIAGLGILSAAGLLLVQPQSLLGALCLGGPLALGGLLFAFHFRSGLQVRNPVEHLASEAVGEKL